MSRRKKKAQKPNTPYTLPKVLAGKPDKLMLAMDPGSRNFGIALVGLEHGVAKCYLNSVMMKPVNDLVAFAITRRNFLTEVKGWMKYEPNGIIAERFQTRGGSSMGPLIEQVSAMLGLIGGTYPDTPIKLTIASVWKNSMQRRFDIDLKEVYKRVRVQPHQLDASLIGIYGLEQGLGITIDFDFEDWIKQVESTSRIPLRRERKVKEQS